MLNVEALEIDDHILAKIEAKHSVTFEEVEEAIGCDRPHVRRGREGLYQWFGRTDAGRPLFIVLAGKGAGVWRIVTAREMTERERRLYEEHGGAL